MTWWQLVLQFIPPLVAIIAGVFWAREPVMRMRSEQKRERELRETLQSGTLMHLPVSTTVEYINGYCPNANRCSDPSWCEQCSSCDEARKIAGSVEPDTMLAPTSAQWRDLQWWLALHEGKLHDLVHGCEGRYPPTREELVEIEGEIAERVAALPPDLALTYALNVHGVLTRQFIAVEERVRSD